MSVRSGGCGASLFDSGSSRKTMHLLREEKIIPRLIWINLGTAYVDIIPRRSDAGSRHFTQLLNTQLLNDVSQQDLVLDINYQQWN